MKTKRQKGLTLVALMAGVAAGAIVLLAAGTALVAGHTFWNKAWQKVNLQRDASYAMLTISRSIKEGSNAQLENDGKAVRIYREADWIRFFSPSGTNDLECEIEGGEPHTIINGYVEDVTFTLQGGLLGIDLRLKRDDLKTRFVSKLMMRNYGG